MMLRLFLLIAGLVSLGQTALASSSGSTTILQDLNVRRTSISTTTHTNGVLDDFIGPIASFFYTPTDVGGDGVINAFTVIAFQVKNILIVIAIVFLIIAVLKLLYSSNSDEDVKKWRNSIIWITVGIFFLQIVYSVWNTLLLRDSTQGIDGNIAWTLWSNVLSPIVGMLQFLASFAFLLMVIYAFFTIVGGAGDEEKLKKGRRTIIYGLVGFFLIRFPKAIIDLIYGAPSQTCITLNSSTSSIDCAIQNQDLHGLVGIMGKVIQYLNGFLFLVAVILVIYAGWLVLTSAGDDEKLKKARSTILYVFIGFAVLIASHAIFRFFILQS